MTAFTCASAPPLARIQSGAEQKQRWARASAPHPCCSSLRPLQFPSAPAAAARRDSVIVHFVCVGVFAGVARVRACVCVCWSLVFVIPCAPTLSFIRARPAAHRLSVSGFTVCRPRLLQHVGG